MRLAEMVEPGQPGWTRRVFTPEYLKSRELVWELMASSGLEVRRDPAGNLIGALRGTDAELPALILGSHTDTVAGGGRFDGPCGVMAAIEAVRRIREGGIRPRRSVWVVDFLGEEPNDFGISCVGSRAAAGHLSPEHLQLVDRTGRTLAEALAQMGGDPDRIAEALWPAGTASAYLELHVEQGTRLEEAARGLAVVTAIAGIHRAEVRLEGRADHAGTTPMDRRRDALLAAAEVGLQVERLGRREGLGVATVGRLEVEPNSPNVVAERATLIAEYRSGDSNWLSATDRLLQELVTQVPARRGVLGQLTWLSREEPTVCAEGLRAVLRDSARAIGEEPLELPSWAGHDAVQVASNCPVAMIFVPSRGGRSHCPEEWTEPEQVEVGVRALTEAVTRLAG
jgi:N-carbamoyl-L-amino-acid hydrolase